MFFTLEVSCSISVFFSPHETVLQRVFFIHLLLNNDIEHIKTKHFYINITRSANK